MKKLLSFILFVINATTLFAQAPESMNYQAIARDNTGAALPNTAIPVEFKIHNDSLNGTIVYSEQQSLTTNQFGLFTAAIGAGTVTSLGNFNTIPWANGNKFLEVIVDNISMGATQLLSVPYALYAASGNQGPMGNDGATWYTGTTIPSNATGVVNDLYLRTTNGNYYKKTGAATWTLQGNLTGATGAVGANGSNGATWYTGTTVPGNATGVVNDLYLRTTNSDYYKKTGAATWVLQGNLTGATGAVGANGTNGAAGTNGGNGATWYTGTTIPGNGTGVVNDLYLRTTNSDYYKKTGAATWVLQGNLTGATGSAGANGTNGATGSNGSNGATWYTGTTIPGNATGVVNDLYLRTTNDDYYKKTGAATWTLQGNLTGSNGIAGTNGAAGINGAIWYTGTTIPGNATGVINDLYLRTTTGDYYKKTGINTWTLQANLTGPAGVTGAAGSANINGTLNHLIKFNNATSGINSQIFDNGTKVGVGTTSPTSLFHINTDGTLSNGLRVSATTPATIGASITLEGASKTWNILATNTSAIPGANKLVFRDFTSAADRMIIDATGNVGIGISSPLAKLHVVKSGSAAATGILGQINSTGTNDYNGVEGIAQGTGRQFGIKGTASGPAGLIYDSYADYGSAAGLFLSAAGTGIMANTTGVDSLNCSGSTPRGTSGFCSTQSRGIVSNVNSTAEYQTAIVAQASSPLPYQNIGVNAYANNGTYAYGIIATATNGTDGTYAIDAYAEGTSTDDVYGIHAYAFNGGSGNAYAGYFSGDVVNSGYTQLGYSSPAIQMRKYTGTTASTQGGSVTINTGLTPSKILSVDIMVEWGTNSFLHPGYNLNPGYEFFWFGGSSIVVANSGNNSGLILSKPFKILVTYEK